MTWKTLVPGWMSVAAVRATPLAWLLVSLTRVGAQNCLCRGQSRRWH